MTEEVSYQDLLDWINENIAFLERLRRNELYVDVYEGEIRNFKRMKRIVLNTMRGSDYEARND